MCVKTSEGATDQRPLASSKAMLPRCAATRTRFLRPTLSGSSIVPRSGRPRERVTAR